jgi:PqqD family protein of HPr-rel-A system
MYYCADDVIVTDLEHELILLDPRSGKMFSLNETSRRVWLSLPAPSAVELANALEAEFDVESEVARADVQALLHELATAGLVQQVP